MRNLASIVVDDAETRRATTAKLSRLMPKDAAGSFANITQGYLHFDRQGNLKRLPSDPHESGLDAVRRARIFVPLIEPNVSGWGRVNIFPNPRPTNTGDGILTVTWRTLAEHHAATKMVYDYYRRDHPLVAQEVDGETYFGLDSWHSPITLAAVRHRYNDGTPGVTRWMSVDGTARVLFLRNQIAAALGDRLNDHPWKNPSSDWPTDTTTWRQFLAICRARAEKKAAEINEGLDPGQDPVRAEHLHLSPKIEDWGDFVLPHPGRDVVGDLEMWNFRTHTSSARYDLDDPDEDLDDDYDDVDEASMTPEQIAAADARGAELEAAVRRLFQEPNAR